MPVKRKNERRFDDAERKILVYVYFAFFAAKPPR